MPCLASIFGFYKKLYIPLYIFLKKLMITELLMFIKYLYTKQSGKANGICVKD